MNPQIPTLLSIAFIAITFITLWLGYAAIKDKQQHRWIVLLSAVWLGLQAVLAWKGVYLDATVLPPKIVLFGVLPALLLVISPFTTRSGRIFLDSLSLERLTYLHIIRIPVELVLYGLFIGQTIPEIMTFEGRNFDILAGITAPIVAYFGIRKKKMSRGALLVWNLAALGFLLNIVITAFLSAPSPLQRLAFEQPNVAILYFPLVWLPVFVVPVVLFSHLAAIRQLIFRIYP
jgi:hypothetical protein